MSPYRHRFAHPRPFQMPRAAQRRSPRPLQVETLESRVVLSALPDVVMPTDPVPSDVPEAQTTVSAEAVASPSAALANQDATYQAADGTVHVQPASSDTPVSIQQLVNYRMQSVVEVHLGHAWVSFAAQSVTGIVVHAVDAQQPVQVGANVDKSVVLVEPGSIGRVLVEPPTAASVASPLPEELAWPAHLAAPATTPVVMGPLGEGEIGGGTLGGGGGPGDPGDPGDPGGSGEVTGRPVIEDFAAQAEGPVWRFYGYVHDDDPVEGLTVAFGGLLKGRVAVVDFNGLFEVILWLGQYPKGIVTAVTWDRDGLQSETVSMVIG